MAKQVTLNLIVDKSCNRVRFAESDGHFIDILLSFLTLPLGSILQLTKQSIGSINNLLQSVQSLDSVCFSSEACRSMLLCPANSASHLFNSLPIKYDNISNLFAFYYTCSSCSNNRLCFYANAHCKCGKLMDKKLEFMAKAASSNAEYSSVFFNDAFKFTISDDLHVSQTSVEFAIEQLSKLDINQMSSLESMSVNVTAENIIEVLKRMLASDTPLTDVFLGVHKKDKLQLIQHPLRAKCNETQALDVSSRKSSLKLYVSKEEETALLAEADNDFVDLLSRQSGLRCMDNLYNSVEALKSANCFRNKEWIGKFLNPKLPPYFKARNYLIQLTEENQTQNYFTCRYASCQNTHKVCNNRFECKHYEGTSAHILIQSKQLYLTDPKCGSNGEPNKGGYMKISRYVITDNLVIRQPSSFMVITDIFKEVARKGIHAKNVEIGEKEALALLCASITSENALTDGLLGVESGKRRCRSY